MLQQTLKRKSSNFSSEILRLLAWLLLCLSTAILIATHYLLELLGHVSREQKKCEYTEVHLL